MLCRLTVDEQIDDKLGFPVRKNRSIDRTEGYVNVGGKVLKKGRKASRCIM